MLGPLDLRTRVTRCEACARRRIKCHGGIPCDYCTRMHKTCVPPVQKDRPTVFVYHLAERTQTSLAVSVSTAASHPLPSPSSPPLDCVLSYFFSTFLTSHDFTGRSGPGLGILVSSCQTSPCLHFAILAVSSLDMGKRLPNRAPSKILAINAYRESLVALQAELQEGVILQKEACLWSTFFLGIFELMYDPSGDGWVNHILYGTSKMLQARGPEQHISGSGRAFFLAIRVFEICRALIYVEDTILSEERWKDATRQMWTTSSHDWHPKEALFDILIDCASLRCRTHDAVTVCENTPQESHLSLLTSVAVEGFRIQEALAQWHAQAFEWQSMTSPSIVLPPHDFQMVLAIIYYHATRIFLSGIFDYHPQFNNILYPNLTTAGVQSDLSAILTLTEVALKKTNLASVLFFYPLRVAGARAWTDEQRSRILDMLRDIARRNFVVADTFTEDLSRLWSSWAI